ncbi:MAG: segregation/condensation protein A [Tepidisphaera sp.]
MLTEDYKVRLDAFEGPLDLLLFLIRKNELEVEDVPVAMIAGQYMQFLGQIDKVDIDVAGEFLLMAATLTEIKSRMVAFQQQPSPTAEDDGHAKAKKEDPRAELVRQLLAYKAYRDAAAALEGRLADWQSRFPSSAVLPNDKDPAVAAIKRALADSQAALELEDLELVDLTEAFRKVMETVNFDRIGDHQVTYDDTPIEAHATDIMTVLQAPDASASPTREVEFAQVFKGRTRSQMVGLFLALLMLVRDRKVAVRQDRIDGAIYLGVQTGDAQTESVPAPAGS